MFADRLRSVRAERGLSQAELSEALGISRSALSGYESGRKLEPNYGTLTKIADYFGVSVDWLLGRTEVRHMRASDVRTIDDIKHYLGGARRNSYRRRARGRLNRMDGIARQHRKSQMTSRSHLIQNCKKPLRD